MVSDKEILKSQRLNQLGMTELSFGNHLPVYGEADLNGSGKLLSNCQMRIRDLKTGAWLGVDQSGEIYIKGSFVLI